jgi:Rps23 Pro-64 3,4-dihydroxylase Tpa1-like proline 4-hydroxylase
MAYKSQLKAAAQICGFGGAVSIIFSVLPLSHSAMRESPRDAAAHWVNNKCSTDANIPERHPFIDDAAMTRFKSTGILIIDDVLTAEELRSARKDLQDLLDRNVFEVTEQHSEEIRTDSTCLISEPIENQSITLGTGMRDALRLVRSIPLELISGGYGAEENLYGVPLSNQLSCYDSLGSHYKPHRDTPDLNQYHPLKWLLQAGLNERETTIILYLNDVDWDSGAVDDGCLRCFLGTATDDDVGTTATEVLNIAPKGGRLVIFDSKKILHEVRPCSKRRAAITCWVGGSHGMYAFMRPFCIPYAEMNFFKSKI